MAIVHPMRIRASAAEANDWNATALFENTVRSVTGDVSYQFGDWTRGARDQGARTISELTGQDASEYRFGDVTKKARRARY